MKLRKITYYKNKKKHSIKVEVCDTIWKKFSGLMFRNNSLPLLFPFKKNQVLSIHSFFCKPFIALWLDDKFNVKKELKIKKWKINFSGNGKYLLEIPLSSKK